MLSKVLVILSLLVGVVTIQYCKSAGTRRGRVGEVEGNPKGMDSLPAALALTTATLPAYDAAKIQPGVGPSVQGAEKPCANRAGSPHPDQGSGLCTGNNYLEISIPTTGLTLSYNSLNQNMQFGFGWGFSLSADPRFVRTSPSSVLLLLGDGTPVQYHGGGTAFWADDARFTDGAIDLSYTNEYIVRDPNGTQYSYKQVPSDTTVYAIAKVTDRNGNSTTYQRTSNGLITSITDVFGKKVTFTQINGLIVGITDNAGSIYQLNYDSSGRLSSFVQPDNRSWKFTYSGTSNLVASSTDLEGDRLLYTYYSSNDLESITNNMGYVTVLYYTRNAVTMATSFDTDTELFNQNGSIISSTHNGLTTQYEYDSRNRLSNVIESSGKKTGFAYDSTDSLVSTVTSHLNREGTTIYTRNPSRQLTSTNFTLGSSSTTTTYDPSQFGLPVSVSENATDNSSYYYDAKGNLSSVSHNGTQIAGYTYYPNGQLFTETNQMGMTTTYSYDSLGFLATVTDSFGRLTSYTNDALGNTTKVVTPTMTVTDQYDAMGQVIGTSNIKGNSGVGATVSRTNTISYAGSGAPRLKTSIVKTAPNWQSQRQTQFLAPPDAPGGTVASDIITDFRGDTYDFEN